MHPIAEGLLFSIKMNLHIALPGTKILYKQFPGYCIATEEDKLKLCSSWTRFYCQKQRFLLAGDKLFTAYNMASSGLMKILNDFHHLRCIGVGMSCKFFYRYMLWLMVNHICNGRCYDQCHMVLNAIVMPMVCMADVMPKCGRCYGH